MSWPVDPRPAKSLLILRKAFDQAYPTRDKSSDGMLAGDEHHKQNPNSDHEADKNGVVRAIDISRDTSVGLDTNKVADYMRMHPDVRARYIISNRRIAGNPEFVKTNYGGSHMPWQWIPYNGNNPHDHHMHVSLVRTDLADDERAWDIGPTLKTDSPDTVVNSPVPPTIRRGSKGETVRQLQVLLGITQDSEFDQGTEAAVKAFQTLNGLVADGVVGPYTWRALKTGKIPDQPKPDPVTPPPVTSGQTELTGAQVAMISAMAGTSPIARYFWKNRGMAPVGYIKGLALTFGQLVLDWKNGHSAARLMATPNSGNSSLDALAWYNEQFKALGMSNTQAGLDTLRHVFVLLIGLGMRESSGNCFEGRDKSASNTTAETAEAGLFQQSHNSFSASPELPKLMMTYMAHPSWGFLDFFKQGLSGGPSPDLGSGNGAAFQRLCKVAPAFAAEAAGIGLRTIRQHWGPINRHEAELRPEADALFKQVQDMVMSPAGQAVAPDNPLAGKVYRYLIGADGNIEGVDGTVTEPGYDATKPPLKGVGVKYGNLFDEKNSGNYGPYLKTSDTAQEYGEGQIDPRGPGWGNNIRDQLKIAQHEGWKFIEWDNPDAYDLQDVLGAINITQTFGIKVVAKNAFLLGADDGATYLKHPNVYGLIVEAGAGNPAQVHAMRAKAGKPDLPTTFVFFGDKKGAAQQYANQITAGGYKGMGVSYSSQGEYGSSDTILAPT